MKHILVQTVSPCVRNLTFFKGCQNESESGNKEGRRFFSKDSKSIKKVNNIRSAGADLALVFGTFCSLGLIQNLHLAGVSIFSEGLTPVGVV